MASMAPHRQVGVPVVRHHPYSRIEEGGDSKVVVWVETIAMEAVDTAIAEVVAAVVEDRRLGMEEDIPVRLDGNEIVVAVVVAVAAGPIVAMTTAEEDTMEADMETIIVATIEEVAAAVVAGAGVKCCFVHRYRLLLLWKSISK